MLIRVNLVEAVRSLNSSKQRSILALVGIVIGIGSVIAMVSVGKIVQTETLRQFKEMGTDILTVRSEYRGGDQAGDKSIPLQVVLQLDERCPALAESAPYTSNYGSLSYGGERYDVPVLGVTRSAMDIFKIPLSSGRFISDLDKSSSFCVIGPAVAKKLRNAGLRDPLGEKIVYEQRIFTIIGTTGSVELGMMRPYEINEGIFIPIAASMRLPGRSGVRTVITRLASEDRRAEAQSQIRHFLLEQSPGLNLDISSAEEIISSMEKQMQMFTLLLGAIGSISLLVGGVGVMNVMLVSVSERRKEIGIRRALGAQRSDIQSQFLIESLVLSLIGGILGIGTGLGASFAISSFSDWQFFIYWPSMYLGVGVSMAVGIFFGYYPARQASRLSPIEALRSE
ncbi:MAG: ABC transporter permease [Desulfovibrionales bacterium]